MIIGPQPATALRYLDGLIYDERYQGDFGLDVPRSVARIDGYGAMIGGRLGLVYLSQGREAEWTQLVDDTSAYGGDIYVFHEDRGWLVYGGNAGTVVMYELATKRFCPPVQIARDRIVQLVPLENTILARVLHDPDADAHVMMLRIDY